MVFSAVLWIGEGRRRFDELSIPRFALMGAMAGIVLGTWALSSGFASGLSSLWLRAAVAIGPVTVLSAASASASLALARKAEERQTVRGGADPSDRTLAGDGPQ